jgi:hypothetical protein
MADFTTEPRKLIFQLVGPTAKGSSDIIAKLQKAHRRTLNQDLFWPFPSPKKAT